MHRTGSGRFDTAKQILARVCYCSALAILAACASKRLLAFAFVTGLIAACSGGVDSDGPPPPPTPANLTLTTIFFSNSRVQVAFDGATYFVGPAAVEAFIGGNIDVTTPVHWSNSGTGGSGDDFPQGIGCTPPPEVCQTFGGS